MPKLLEIVPEDLRGKEYLKDLIDLEQGPETFTKVFKKLDGAESLIGKRPAIPDSKTAKPEELEKFFEQFRADKADDYEIPLEKDSKVDQSFVKAVKEAFHAGSINKVQANKFLKRVSEYSVEARKAAEVAQARKTAEFETLSKTYLGEQNKAKMERVRTFMKEYAPSTAQGNLDKLPDEQLVIMASIVDAVLTKYVPADDLAGKGSGKDGGSGGGVGPTAKDKMAEMERLMGEKSYGDVWHKDHEATFAKVKQLAKEIAELQKRA